METLARPSRTRAGRRLIATLTAQRDRLTRAGRELRGSGRGPYRRRGDRLSGAVDAAEGARSTLATRLETTEGELGRVIDEREALQLALARARDEIDAQAPRRHGSRRRRRDAVEALVAELRAGAEGREATLAQTLAALAEQQEAARRSLQAGADDLEADLDAAETARLAELAAAEALRDRLARDRDARCRRRRPRGWRTRPRPKRCVRRLARRGDGADRA